MNRVKSMHASLRSIAIIGFIYRGFVLTLGFVALFLGILMLALPGPGILTIIMALSILSTEFTWAQTMLVKTKARGEKLLEDAKAKVSRKEPKLAVNYVNGSK